MNGGDKFDAIKSCVEDNIVKIRNLRGRRKIYIKYEILTKAQHLFNNIIYEFKLNHTDTRFLIKTIKQNMGGLGVKNLLYFNNAPLKKWILNFLGIGAACGLG